MSTVTTRIGPQDHGRRMTLDEFEFAEVQEGHLYELSRGVVTVSDVPNRKHLLQVNATRRQLDRYGDQFPDRIAAVLTGSECKLLVPPLESERHPDLAIYLSPPPADDSDEMWRHWLPGIVVEVVSLSSKYRDYVEKREEYFRIGIQEYWIIDLEKQQMLALRRGDEEWIEHVVQPSDVYRTDLLPGLEFSLEAVFAAAA
jgi:Uma2 family endonuclease